MNCTRCVVALAATAAIPGCDALVDGGHRGEPLAQVSISVQDIRTRSADGVDVVVLWQNNEGSPDIAGAESVSVAGNFPTQFQLSIYEPPEHALRFGSGENLGIALIVALPKGTDTSRASTVFDKAIGVEKNHLLVWASGELPATDSWPYLLHNNPTAGFHIFDVGRFDEAERQRRYDCLPNTTSEAEIRTVCGGSPFWDDLHPAAADLATELSIDLVDAVPEEDFPDWN
jgi:hypothetical protein